MRPRTVKALLWLPFVIGALVWLALAIATGALPGPASGGAANAGVITIYRQAKPITDRIPVCPQQ